MQGKLEPSPNTKLHVSGGPKNNPEDWWTDQWDINDENDVRLDNYIFQPSNRFSCVSITKK